MMLGNKQKLTQKLWRQTRGKPAVRRITDTTQAWHLQRPAALHSPNSLTPTASCLLFLNCSPSPTNPACPPRRQGATLHTTAGGKHKRLHSYPAPVSVLLQRGPQTILPSWIKWSREKGEKRIFNWDIKVENEKPTKQMETVPSAATRAPEPEGREAKATRREEGGNKTCEVPWRKNKHGYSEVRKLPSVHPKIRKAGSHNKPVNVEVTAMVPCRERKQKQSEGFSFSCGHWRKEEHLYGSKWMQIYLVETGSE